MTPADKAARLLLLRESWERYRLEHPRSGDSPQAAEPSGGAIFCERLTEENLATFADVGEPDALSALASGA